MGYTGCFADCLTVKSAKSTQFWIDFSTACSPTVLGIPEPVAVNSTWSKVVAAICLYAAISAFVEWLCGCDHCDDSAWSCFIWEFRLCLL